MVGMGRGPVWGSDFERGVSGGVGEWGQDKGMEGRGWEGEGGEGEGAVRLFRLLASRIDMARNTMVLGIVSPATSGPGKGIIGVGHITLLDANSSILVKIGRPEKNEKDAKFA